LRAFSEKPNAETSMANAQARRSFPSGGFLRRQPGHMPLVAWRMYQCGPALERAMGHLFEDFMTVKTR
jgi:hypothetical protein